MFCIIRIKLAFSPKRIVIQSIVNEDTHLCFCLYPQYQDEIPIDEKGLNKVKQTLNNALEEVMKRRYIK